MNFENFIQWAFYSVISGVAIAAVSILRDMNKSIQLLNVNFAVLLTKSESQDKRIDKHDERIERLEDQT